MCIYFTLVLDVINVGFEILAFCANGYNVFLKNQRYSREAEESCNLEGQTQRVNKFRPKFEATCTNSWLRITANLASFLNIYNINAYLSNSVFSVSF
jgi:hypothetical protein